MSDTILSVLHESTCLKLKKIPCELGTTIPSLPMMTMCSDLQKWMHEKKKKKTYYDDFKV